jgi:hypothetical protein
LRSARCFALRAAAMAARTGARWSETETAELGKAFKSGGSIGQLAKIHNRTQYAIEAQLERLGLWDRAARQPVGRAAGRDLAGPDGEASPWPSPSFPAPAAGRRDSGEKPG